MAQIILTNSIAPTTPGAGTVSVYSKTSDKRLYYKDDAGVEIGPLITSTGGTVTATSGVLTANALVVGNGTTDEKVLASLGTTGQVLTSAGAGTPPVWASIDVATAIHTATNKVTPVGADELGIWDSVSGLLNKLSLTNLLASISSSISSLSIATGVAVHGTNTNNSAAAGYVGEYASSVTALVNAPTSSTWGDIASISLTAGDWDVSLVMNCTLNGAVQTVFAAGVGIVSGNNAPATGDFTLTSPPTTGKDVGLSIPSVHILTASTIPVYIKGYAVYTGGPPQYYGRISARRVR